MKSFTKDEFIEYVALQTNQTNVHTKRMIEGVFESIALIVARDHGEVNITKFGSFSAVPTKERMGRNPKTGEPVNIEASYRMSFKPSSVLKKAIKGK